MKNNSWQCNMIAPVGIIICMILMMLEGNCKIIDIVCSIIIGMQIMLIMDFLITKVKIKEKTIY